MANERITEEDVRRAAEGFDADLAAQGAAPFTSGQIAAFQALAAEPDVFERARRTQELGERLLRETEESMRRYEEVRRQAEELGIDLRGDLEGDAQRARERSTEDYLERTQREVAAEARRLFGDAVGGESAARTMSRGAGRMRV